MSKAELEKAAELMKGMKTQADNPSDAVAVADEMESRDCNDWLIADGLEQNSLVQLGDEILAKSRDLDLEQD